MHSSVVGVAGDGSNHAVRAMAVAVRGSSTDGSFPRQAWRPSRRPTERGCLCECIVERAMSRLPRVPEGTSLDRGERA
jgi:hypothetical protein